MTAARGEAAGPRRLLAGVATAAAVAAAAGVVGALGGHDDGPQAGDARITMRDFAFQPAVVHVASDSGLFVENLDPTRHDITIDGDVIVDVPGQGARRTDITLAAGHHVIICSLHPSMTGAVELASP